jgi:NDP-sugar pyrophosphorylase family protein
MMQQAVILAGGKGSRLRPLTDSVPKPLLPIHGKPALESILNNLRDAGIIRVLLTLEYKSEMIKSYVEANQGFGLEVSYLIQDPNAQTSSGMAGMAYSLGRVRDLVQGNFLLAAADTVFEPGYMHDLMLDHETRHADATLSVSDLGRREYLVGRSVVDVDDESRVRAIVEKPTLEEVFSTYVSTPLYALSPRVFTFIPMIRPSVRGEYELQSVLQLMIDQGLRVYSCFNAEWNDLSKWKMLNDGYDLLRLNFPYLEKRLEPR